MTAQHDLLTGGEPQYLLLALRARLAAHYAHENLMAAADDTFLTVADIAKILKLNQQTVRNWIDAGKLPAMKIGRRVRIRRSDFEQFVEHGRINQPPRPRRATAEAFWEGELAMEPAANRHYRDTA